MKIRVFKKGKLVGKPPPVGPGHGEECPYCGTTDNRHPRWCHAEIWPRPEKTQQVKSEYL